MTFFINTIIAITSFINSFDAVSIGKFYLVSLPLVTQINELGKIVRCLTHWGQVTHICAD